MTAITAHALSKRYTLKDSPEILALDSVDLAIAPGEIYALLGPNGAGKTTLISILTTLLLPTGGEARVAGHNVVDAPAQVRRRIGVTFQETVLDQHLTGRQSLEFHGRLYGMNARQIAAAIDELGTLVQLEDALNRKIGSYSGGMKRRLELIRGLLTRPEILFLDEPTQGLDPQNRLAIWDYLAQLRRQYNLTILLTTHYMEEAETLADRVGIIDRGRLVVEGPPKELSASLGQDMIVINGTAGVSTANGERSSDERLYTMLDSAAWTSHVTRFELPGEQVGTPTAAETDASTEMCHLTLQVGVDNGAARLVDVVSIAADAGFRIHDLTVNRPTLADVFLAATGANLSTEDS